MGAIRRYLGCQPVPAQKHTERGRIRYLSNKIRTMRARRTKETQQQYRKHWFYNRATWDVERGGGDGQEEYVGPEIDLEYSVPERAALAHIFCKQPDDLGDEELLELRIRAGEQMATLAGKRETVKRDTTRQRGAEGAPNLESPGAGLGVPPGRPLAVQSDLASADEGGVYLLPCRMKRGGGGQCPRCVGDDKVDVQGEVSGLCAERPLRPEAPAGAAGDGSQGPPGLRPPQLSGPPEACSH